MLRVLVQFPSGRHHATPWGRHVNEGDVEWPPSPWRLYRALLAVGFNRLGWPSVPAEAIELFESLARCLPTFFLPAATAAHTRHYMPQFKGSTSKVLDAFAYVGRGDEDVLGIAWDVNPSENVLRLFDALLGVWSYLGRAESWIDARRVDSFPEGLDPCAASESAPGPHYDRVPLLAPLEPKELVVWRDQAVEQEKRKRSTNTTDESDAGKKSRKGAKGLSKKELETIEGLFPANIVTALAADTATLQKQGWNQPPGTRWVSYWRSRGALTTLPADRKPVTVERSSADTALLALSSNTVHGEVLPRFTEALRWTEKLHATLVRKSAEDGRASPCLSGCDESGRPLDGHRHVTLVPLCLDAREGRLDHLLLHTPMGLDDAAVRALRRVRVLFADRHKKNPDLFVSLVGLGHRTDFHAHVRQLETNRVWISETPFVPPRFLKERGTNSLEGQIRAECVSRGLPAVQNVEVQLEGGWAHAERFWSLWRSGALTVRLADETEGADAGRANETLSSKWRHFRRWRYDHAKRPPLDAAFGLRLTFAEAVMGPIALGYASHFGLGQFVPA